MCNVGLYNEYGMEHLKVVIMYYYGVSYIMIELLLRTRMCIGTSWHQ